MKNGENGFLSEVLSSRRNIVELIVVAILLAVGVNLLSDGIKSFFNFSSFVSLLLGISVCLITILYFFIRFSSNMSRNKVFRPIFCYNNKTNKLVPISRYKFVTDLIKYIEAACLENKDIQFVWEEYPLKDEYTLLDDDDQSRSKSFRSMQLIKEAIEYLVLKSLSDHLAEYFAEEGTNIDVYEREDTPDIMMKNRFLDLFSKPIEERVQFAQTVSRMRFLQNILSVSTIDGAYYENFKLILPKGSKVKRYGKRSLLIETRKFILHISVDFNGQATELPSDFVKYYLKTEDISELKIFMATIKVGVIFKPAVLLSWTGLHYYWWIDSFIDSFEREVSIDRFLDDINWDTAMTIIHHIKNT